MTSIREPRWAESVAFFGGTFNPPHLGHRTAVIGLFENPGVRQVRILPSGTPPQKSSSGTLGLPHAEERFEMALLNFQDSPGILEGHPVEVDRRELESSLATQKKSYTFETLQALRTEFQQMAFVIGVDQLENLHSWYRFPEILGSCHWIVLARKPHGNERALSVLRQWEASGLCKSIVPEKSWALQSGPGSAWKSSQRASVLRLVPTPAQEISSQEIRATLGKTGSPPEGVLHPEVWTYLKSRRLYGSGVL